MRIDRLKLYQFGKFKNKQIEFKDGLNIVYGLNESGKSTIQMFILSMLYGGKSSNIKDSRDIKDMFLKYKPWKEERGDFGGEIEYRLGKEDYLLERNFDARGRTIIFNKATGEDITEQFRSSRGAEPRILEKQLGMNRMCFMNTIFCKQKGIAEVKNAREYILQKLANVSESGDEELSISGSIDALEKLKNEIGSSDKNSKTRGRIFSKLEDCKKKLNDICKVEKEIEALQEDYKGKQEECKRLKASLSERQKIISCTIGVETYLKETAATVESMEVNREVDILKRVWEEYKENLKKHEALKNSINEVSKEYNRLKAILEEVDTEKVCEIEVMYVKLCNETAICRKQIQTFEVLLQDKKKIDNDFTKFYFVKRYSLIIATVLIAAISGIAATYSLFCLAGLLLCCMALVKLGFMKSSYKLKKDAMMFDIKEICYERDENEQILELRQREYDKLRNDIGGEPGEFFDKIKELKNMCKRQQELDITIRTDTLNLKALQAELEFQYKETFHLIKSITGNEVHSSHIEEIIEKIFDECNKYGRYINIDKYRKDGHELNVKQLTDEVQASERAIKVALGELQLIEEKINLKLDKLKSLGQKEEIVAQIAMTQEEYEKVKEDFEAADLAIKVLMDSKERVQEQYGRLIVDNIGAKISKITGGRYKVANVDDIIDIKTKNEQDIEVSVENLSGGTLDQFYFSWRTALAEVLSNDRYHLPIIIDEPFAQYDDKRLEDAISVLNQMAKERQIIFFTCQKRDIELTKNVCAQKFNLICL